VPGQPGRGRAVLRIGRVVGAAALAALVLAYRTADGRAMVLGPLFDPSDTVWLRHSWWGILGLTSRQVPNCDTTRRLQCLPWDADTGLKWAELLGRLRTTGRAMPVKDSLIAATGDDYGLAVAA